MQAKPPCNPGHLAGAQTLPVARCVNRPAVPPDEAAFLIRTRARTEDDPTRRSYTTPPMLGPRSSSGQVEQYYATIDTVEMWGSCFLMLRVCYMRPDLTAGALERSRHYSSINRGKEVGMKCRLQTVHRDKADPGENEQHGDFHEGSDCGCQGLRTGAAIQRYCDSSGQSIFVTL